MKLAIIGGAGVRTPLLMHGLSQSDLPIDTISLYDRGARAARRRRAAGCAEGRQGARPRWPQKSPPAWKVPIS